MANNSMVTYKQPSSIAPVYQQELSNIGNNITECLKKIKDTEGKAYDAKNITGIFAGKKRDDALADVLVLSAETQAQTVTLIQEIVKLFLYCFKMQDETNLERNENIFNYIISMTDDEETNEFLSELGEAFSSYKSSIRLRIEEIREQIGLTDEKINNVRDIANDNAERIAAADGKNAERDKRLDAGDERDRIQDKKDAEHDKRLDDQDKKLEERISKDEEHDKILKEYSELFEKQKESIKSLSEEVNALKVKVNAFSICAIVALIIGITHFFI